MRKVIRYLICIVCLVIIGKNQIYQDVSVIFPTEKERTETNYIIIHHTGNCEHFTIGEVDDYHTKKGWGSGFAYNFFLANNTIYKVKDTDSPTANCLGHNSDAVAICVDGNFDLEEPNMITRIELLCLIKILTIIYPSAKVKCHSDLNATNCCGDAIERIIHDKYGQEN